MKTVHTIFFVTMLIAGCSSDVEKCAEAYVDAGRAEKLNEAQIKKVRADAYAYCLRASKGE